MQECSEERYDKLTITALRGYFLFEQPKGEALGPVEVPRCQYSISI